MGFKLVELDGETCPVLVCDSCGLAIDSEHDGNVVWQYGEPDSVRFVHKGKVCDFDKEKYPASEEVADWLSYLVYNFNTPDPHLRRGVE